jgi:hypothetical protein
MPYYHITDIINLPSIQEFGLGAKKGKGIDLDFSKKGMVYCIDFNPIPYLQHDPCHGLNGDQMKLVHRICKYILTIQKRPSVTLAVLEFDIEPLIPDPSDEYVYIYYGTIQNFHVNICKYVNYSFVSKKSILSTI